MIRNLVLLSVLVVIGLGPALAQDIFIKKESAEASEDGEKQTIYNKSFVKKFGKKKNSFIKYSDKLEVQKHKKDSAELMLALEYWRENKTKPSNAEEIVLYAQANRARALNLMAQRREKLVEHLAKEERKLQAELGSSSFGVYAIEDDPKQEENRQLLEAAMVTDVSSFLGIEPLPVMNVSNITGATAGPVIQSEPVKQSKPKKPRLFVSKEKSADEKAKPSRVFNNFR